MSIESAETEIKIHKYRAVLADVKQEALHPAIKQRGITPTMKARMMLGLSSRTTRAQVIHELESEIDRLTEFVRTYLKNNRKKAHQI